METDIKMECIPVNNLEVILVGEIQTEQIFQDVRNLVIELGQPSRYDVLATIN